MRIGIYGGTFNPIHKGHLHFATNALDELSLDKVLLLPNSQPPHKYDRELASGFNRLEMCKVATKSDSRLEVCDVEIKRGGISYTIDTLREIKRENPEDELFFLTGTDMFCSIEKWKEWNNILSLCCLVGAPRRSEDLSDMLLFQESLKEKGYTTIVLPLLPVEISSTEIRAGDEEELDSEVLRYITQNGLYGHEQKVSIDLDEVTQKLRNTLSKKRFIHSVNVANEAIRLADKFEADKGLCYIAGLLHDICKEMDKELLLKMVKRSGIIVDDIFLRAEQIWHGHAGAVYIWEELNIYNTEIIDAIRFHSSANSNLSIIGKIIYMADLISSERNYEGVEELRIKAYQDLDGAMLDAVSFTLKKFIIKRRQVLNYTISAYNELVLSVEEPTEG